YLTWKAREYSYHTRLIETAGEINNDMPDYVIKRMMEILNNDKKSLNGSKVLVLGIAYKPNIDDYRESPIFPIIDQLELAGAESTSVDPHIASFEYLNETIYPPDQVTQELLKSSDIILIGTNHASFDYELRVESETPVFDTRNSYSKKVENSKYYKL